IAQATCPIHIIPDGAVGAPRRAGELEPVTVLAVRAACIPVQLFFRVRTAGIVNHQPLRRDGPAADADGDPPPAEPEPGRAQPVRGCALPARRLRESADCPIFDRSRQGRTSRAPECRMAVPRHMHGDDAPLPGARVLVVEARFYDDIADELLRGACAVLEAAQ